MKSGFQQFAVVGVWIVCGFVFSGARAAEGASTLRLDAFTSGAFRWRDVATNSYGDAYRSSYSYTQAVVQVVFTTHATLLHGTLTATNLKPNFAYQFKLSGFPETAPAANEALGFSGRWWQEEWGGSSWNTVGNLNNKGDGTSPTPNDVAYLSLRDEVEITGSSPTGMRYRFTGYRPFDYFITDAQGNATLTFTMRDTYHMLWGHWQRTPSEDDGAMVWHSFDPDPTSHPAYDTDHPPATRGVFGEWERLPKGKIYLAPGDYSLDFMLTEESFHANFQIDPLAGNWAHALHGAARFTIVRPEIAASALPDHGGTVSLGAGVALDCGASTNVVITPADYWEIDDVAVDGVSRGAIASWTFVEVVSNRNLRATFRPLLAVHDVPQWWLAQRNSSWADDFDAAALADPDGDGQPTWVEYRAGTDPLNGASRFRIASAEVLGGRCRLVWLSPLSDPALPPFVIQRSTNLVDWSVVGEGMRSSDGTNAWWDPAPPAAGAVYYRLTAPF